MRRPAMRVFVLAVALLIVLEVLATLLFVPRDAPEDGGEGGEPAPWVLPAEVLNVTDDETWSGRDVVLDGPLAVRGNATLRLEGCQVTVYLEDLVFWKRPAFLVEAGSSLELVDSDVTVHQDPRLALSVVGQYTDGFHRVPHVARRVNLGNATRPVLHLDVQWMHGGTPLGVAVLPEGGSALEAVGSVEAAGWRPHEWRHAEVGLDAYAGSVPWVVVFPRERPRGLVFIGNATVLDGGQALRGDAFPTGDPLDDGWLCSGFMDLGYYMDFDPVGHRYTLQREYLWSGLIEAEGDVTVSGSSVQAPANLTRYGRRAFDKETLDPRAWRGIDPRGSRGGHIRVRGADLKITDSQIAHVPIVTNGSGVHLEGVRVVGDCDLLSLQEPHGSLADVELVSQEPGPGLPLGYIDRYLWALGVEGASSQGPLEVLGCTFRGGQMGVDLSHASVRLEDCLFQEVEELAIWDHASSGLGGWEQVSEGNRFDRCPDLLYLRTELAEVRFTHPEVPEEDIEIDTGSSLHFDLDLYAPVQGNLGFLRGNRARFMPPQVLVLHNGEVQVAEGSRFAFRWDDERWTHTIEEGQRTIEVDLSEYEDLTDPPFWEEVAAPIGLRSIWAEDGAGSGAFGLDIRIDFTKLVAWNITMRIEVDGELDRLVDVENESWFPGGYQFGVNHSLNLVPGNHRLDLSLWGRVPLDAVNYTDEPVLIDDASLTLLVLGEGSSSDPQRLLEADHVLLGPGVRHSVNASVPLEPPGGELWIRLVGGLGSLLGLSGPWVPPMTALSFEVWGNASLELANASTHTISFLEDRVYWFRPRSPPPSEGSEIRVRNVTCQDLDIYTSHRNVTLRDCRVRDSIYMYAQYGAVVLDGVSLHGSSSWFTLVDCDLQLDNCSLRSELGGRTSVSTAGNSRLDLRDTTIEDVFFGVYLPGRFLPGNLSLNVTGCTLSGEEATLYAGVDLTDITFYDETPSWVPSAEGSIHGNTLVGPGSSVVLHHGLYTQLWGDNRLEGGARLWAMYITRLQVIPPDDTPIHPGYRFMEHEGTESDWPFRAWRWLTLDGEVLLDVTYDPAMEAHPPALAVQLLSRGYRNLVVRGFDVVELDRDNDEGHFPVLPDLYALLEGHVEDWPWEPTR